MTTNTKPNWFLAIIREGTAPPELMQGVLDKFNGLLTQLYSTERPLDEIGVCSVFSGLAEGMREEKVKDARVFLVDLTSSTYIPRTRPLFSRGFIRFNSALARREGPLVTTAASMVLEILRSEPHEAPPPSAPAV